MVVILAGHDASGQDVARMLAGEVGWRLERVDFPRHEIDRAGTVSRVHQIIARAADRREALVVDFRDFPVLETRYRDALRGDLRDVRFVHVAVGSNAEPHDTVTVDARQERTLMIATIRKEFGI